MICALCSKHQWFRDERWHDLIVILDDATSEIYYAQLVDFAHVEWVIPETAEFDSGKWMDINMHVNAGGRERTASEFRSL
jgi:hypothetical protein